MTLVFSSHAYSSFFDLFSPEKELWLSECEISRQLETSKLLVYNKACSAEALENLGEPFEISENFNVPRSLARQVNFWKMIYSHFSMNDYVIQIKPTQRLFLKLCIKNPETRILLNHGDLFRKGSANPANSKDAKEENGSFTDPEHQRMASLMSHIVDPNKYKRQRKAKESETVRVC